MVLYPNKLPESERVCSGICTREKESGLMLIQDLYHIISEGQTGNYTKH